MAGDQQLELDLSDVEREQKEKRLVALITIILLATSPFLIFFFLLLWFYRCFLILWKEHYHPRFGPLPNRFDSILAHECPYTKEQLTNIGYYVKVEDRIDLEDFRSVVEKGLHQLDKNDESRSNRKLYQVLRRWGGFYIGEDERNFSIRDHVRLFSIDEMNQRLEEQCEAKTEKLHVEKKIHEEHFTQDDLSELNLSLMRIPYKKDTSPWEILLLYNPEPKPVSEQPPESQDRISSKATDRNKKWTTIIFLRIPHSFLDGVSVPWFFSNFLDQSPEYAVGKSLNLFSNDSKTSTCTWWSHLASIGKNTMDFVLGVPEFICLRLPFLDRSWPPVELDMTKPRKYHSFTLEFPKSKFWEIQKHDGFQKVKSTTILMATTALSFSEFFKNYSENKNKDKNNQNRSRSILPQSVFMSDSLGVPRGRHQLTNRVALVGLKTPFGTQFLGAKTDRKKLVKEIEQRRNEAKSKYRALKVDKVFVFLYGLLPLALRPTVNICAKAFGISFMLSFETPVTILNKSVVYTSASTVARELPCTYIFCSVQHDKIDATLMVAKQLIDSRPEAKKLADCFQKKFDDIYQDLTRH